MGRISTFSPSYEAYHTLNIKQFTPSQSFGANRDFNGMLPVSKHWELTKDTIFVTYKATPKRLELSFSRNGNNYTQPVYITKLATNLKNGYRYFFICPYTGKRCSKLIRPFGNIGRLGRACIMRSRKSLRPIGRWVIANGP